MSVCVGGLSLNMEIALNNWINSLNTTSSLDIRVAPATRTRGEGGRRPPSPLVIIIIVNGVMCTCGIMARPMYSFPVL